MEVPVVHGEVPVVQGEFPVVQGESRFKYCWTTLFVHSFHSALSTATPPHLRIGSYTTLISGATFCSFELPLYVLVGSQPIALLGPNTPPNEVK